MGSRKNLSVKTFLKKCKKALIGVIVLQKGTDETYCLFDAA